MTTVMKDLKRKRRLWPTLTVSLEVFPWHWAWLPWGYMRVKGGLTFLFIWLGVTIHFGSTFVRWFDD